MANNGSHDDIPGAPQWVRHLLHRVDSRFDVVMETMQEAVANLELATRQFQSLSPRVTELEEWRTQVEREVLELKSMVRRSLTPPGGMPAVQSTPPEDAA